MHLGVKELHAIHLDGVTMASTLALPRPSEKFGTHSTSVVGILVKNSGRGLNSQLGPKAETLVNSVREPAEIPYALYLGAYMNLNLKLQHKPDSR
jgi:hypothetical protein